MPNKKRTFKNKNKRVRLQKYQTNKRRGGSYGRGRPMFDCPICQKKFDSPEKIFSHWEQAHRVQVEEPVIQPPQPAPAPAASQLDSAIARIQAISSAAPRPPRGRPSGASAAAAAAAAAPVIASEDEADVASVAVPERRRRGRPPGQRSAAAAAAAVDDAPIAASPPRPRGRPPGAAAALAAAAVDDAHIAASPSAASTARRAASAAASAAIAEALPQPSAAAAAIEAEAATRVPGRRGRPAVVRGLAADTTLADPRIIPENIITLNSSASCFDLFEGTEPAIAKFLNESCDNLVIFYRPSGQREFNAACCTFSQLRTFLRDGTHLFFQCIRGRSWESYSRDAEAERGPHFLKLFTQSGNIFVDYKQMKQKYIERQNMIFLDFDRVIPLTISYGMSSEMQQVSANHCQNGSEINVYKIII